MNPIRTAAALFVLAAACAMANPPATADPLAKADLSQPRIPAWTADARWYYVKVPRFRNGDPANDPDGVLPWTADWPPLESEAAAPRDATGAVAMPHARRYGGDLRGVLQALPHLDALGVNAILLSPVFHGTGERKLPQPDLRHVDDTYGIKGSFEQAVREGSRPESWVWTPSDMLLRELIHSAHERGMRVVASGVFYGIMTTTSPPAELESYYIAATRRWMDPDGDGNPLDGVDGWMVSVDEGSLRPIDEKTRSFWLRWREAVLKINPQAVVIAGGSLGLSQLTDGPFDIAMHPTSAGSLVDLLGVAPGSRQQAQPFFAAILSNASIAPGATTMANLSLLSGGPRHARLLTALSAAEPLRVGRQLSPGPVPDDSARLRWNLATVIQHFLPGAPATWYGDEVGMFGGMDYYADAPMWWRDLPGATAEHFQTGSFSLVRWLHQIRNDYPALRRGDFRSVLIRDADRVFAFARTLPGEEIVLVVNHGTSKQRVMLPAGKPGELVGVRNPHFKPPPRAKPGAGNADLGDFPHLSVAGARQFVGPDGTIRMWLDPMSVRLVFLGRYAEP
jgi:glycosidase